jgi:deoxyribonuclease-4
VIRFGPAGIPLSCKGRTLRDGISDVHHLGLTAMEVQFIKVNPMSRVVLDEEVGKGGRELPGQLVVEVAPGGKSTVTDVVPVTAPIRRRDTITTLTWSLAKDYSDLHQTRALARALDVDLTLHAPYYVDFFGSQEARERSIRQIQWAGVLADALGARLTLTHLGFYGTGDRADSVHDLSEITQSVSSWLKGFSEGRVRLGIEPSGHPDVFGSREEVLDLAHRVKGVVPVLNLPHLAARERTNFEDAAQLAPVLDQFVEASGGELYLNFSGVEFYGPGEFRLTPIKRGHVRFDPLADLLADREYDVTVISSSPLLEHDAMYMKLLYERALMRKWTKRHAAPVPLPPKVSPSAPPPRKPGGAKPPARPVDRGRTSARRPHRPAPKKGGTGARSHRR